MVRYKYRNLRDIIYYEGFSGLYRGVQRALVTSFCPFKQKFVSFEGVSELGTESPLFVSPDRIHYSGTCLNTTQLQNHAGVYSGPWDTFISPIEELPYFKSFKKHFVDGVEWSDTYFYSEEMRRIKYGISDRHSSTEQLQKRLDFLDKLYYRIRNNGYKTQSDLLDKRPSETINLNNDAPSPELNEIGICIDRDGSLIRHGAGTHRLYIAKLLNVEEVPVQVRVRHSVWEKIRKKYHEGDSEVKKKYKDHPDITYLSTNL